MESSECDPPALHRSCNSPASATTGGGAGSIYQIYPRSFADSNGDGVGDLTGIIDHLDHLGPDGLGIDAIWLSPIYPSPGVDLGYDVSDHERVDPLFGSEEDFDRLVDGAHRRGIRVVLDLVMNHTSDAHRWFESSSAGRTGPERRLVPVARPGRSRRRRHAAAAQQLGVVVRRSGLGSGRRAASSSTSTPSSPSSRSSTGGRRPSRRPSSRWSAAGSARGVDGFRLDVFNVFLKDPELRSNPVQPGTSAWTRQVHIHDRDQPDFMDLIGRFRAIVDEEPGRMSVGELFDGTIETAASLTAERHLVFDWELVGTAVDRRPRSARPSRHARAAFGDDRWPTVVFSNHDQPRHASRLAASAPGRRSATRSPGPPRSCC